MTSKERRISVNATTWRRIDVFMMCACLDGSKEGWHSYRCIYSCALAQLNTTFCCCMFVKSVMDLKSMLRKSHFQSVLVKIFVRNEFVQKKSGTFSSLWFHLLFNYLCRLMIMFANSLGPNQARQNIRIWAVWHSDCIPEIFFSEKVDFENLKNSKRQKAYRITQPAKS